MASAKVPLFPLSAHLMPQGRMSLRIFEPRYTRMVKQVCADESGFIMCMLNAEGDKNTNEHIFPVGTYAKVIDFELLEDGLLGIKVAGLYNVEVRNIETESDGLRIGQYSEQDAWECNVSAQQISPMVERLEEVFERYPDISSLYDSAQFEDPQWVLFRWLELLPIDAKQKQYFLAQKNCKPLLNYLSALMQ